MRGAAAYVVAAAALGCVIVATACGEDRPACYDGDYRACPCGEAGEPTGLQACLPSRDEYGVCVCGGPTPGLDAGGG